MKVLVIGLDGATWNVLDDFLLNSYMPNLKKLKDKGCSGILRSTEPPTTPTAWTTFLTGCEPAKHKVFGFRKYSSFEKNKLTIINASDCKVPNILEELTAQGYKVASINMPYTYPCPKVNGIVIAGLGSAGSKSTFTFPNDFKNELMAKIPDYDVLPNCDFSFADTDYQLFEKNVQMMERSVKQKLEALELINSKVKCDLMMVQFSEPDSLNHVFYSYLDKDSRDNYPRQRDRLFEAFGKLDDAIGQILDYSDTEDLFVVVVSDHGGGPLIANVCPNILLMKWGYLKTQSSLARIINRQIRRWQRNINELKGHKIEKQPDSMNINWKRSKAVLIHNATNGYIYCNLKDRQSWGSIKTQGQYNNIIGDLKKRFSQITISETGEPLFLRVATPKELYGPATDAPEDLGDLILIPKPGYNLRKSISKRKNYLQKSTSSSIAGTHRYEGIYVFSGNMVKHSSNIEASIVDLAPTIYAALGAKLPPYIDGKVMDDIFNKKIGVEYIKDSDYLSRSKRREELSEDEQQIITKKLSELGYL